MQLHDKMLSELVIEFGITYPPRLRIGEVQP